MIRSAWRKWVGASSDVPAQQVARSGTGARMYRHGDVFIAAVAELPADAERRPGAILARGEATGHAHRIAEADDVELFGGEDAGGYLRVGVEAATLVHEEHKPIRLPRGTYRFWIQREYSPKEIRRVVD